MSLADDILVPFTKEEIEERGCHPGMWPGFVYAPYIPTFGNRIHIIPPQPPSVLNFRGARIMNTENNQLFTMHIDFAAIESRTVEFLGLIEDECR